MPQFYPRQISMTFPIVEIESVESSNVGGCLVLLFIADLQKVDKSEGSSFSLGNFGEGGEGYNSKGDKHGPPNA